MALVTQESNEGSVQQAGEVKTLPRNKQINNNRYSLRIKSAQHKMSKSGFPMIECDVEIYSPATITHHQDGQLYNVAGLSCKKYISLKDNMLEGLIGSKATKARGEVSFMEILGLKPEIDTENPDTEQFVGKVFSDVVSAEKRERRTQPTAAQLEANPAAQGDPIIDPETGLPEVSYGIKLGNSVKRTSAVPPVGV